MTLQELRYLVALADHGHFGRAAAACHVTQPTLSAGIRKLENELDLVLCERRRRGILMTRDAEPLVAQARRVLAEVARLGEFARHRHEPLAGVFRLGAIPTVGPYLFPHVVSGLRAAYPLLQLHLHERTTERLLADLQDGHLDAALLSPPVPHRDLDRTDLYREAFVVAMPAGHELTRNRRLRPADLGSESLLLLDEGHCLRDQVLEVCHGPTTPVRELIRGASLETLRNMVAAGVGCTLLPALAAPDAPPADAAVQIRPFGASGPFRTVSLFWRRESPHAASAQLLAGGIRSRLPAAVRPCKTGARRARRA